MNGPDVHERIRARMAQALEALRTEVAGLSETQGRYQASPARWSIARIVEHLALTEKSFGVIVHYFLKRERGEAVPLEYGPPRATDLGGVERAVRASPRATAPEVVAPQEGWSLSEGVRRLEEQAARNVRNLDALRGVDPERASFPNPSYGPLNPLEWLYLAALHKERHTEQIRSVRRDAAFPKG